MRIQSIAKLTAAVATAAALILSGCSEQSPVQPRHTEDTAIALTKGKGGKGGKTTMRDTYPQTASRTLEYLAKWDTYKRATLHLPNGSAFYLQSGVMTPPPGHPKGAPVTLTMSADRDTVRNEIVFTFGPHGATFDPLAEIVLDWSDLGIDIPKLYYIEDDGSYVEQKPASIDIWNKKLHIYLKHFSRYAIGGM